MTVGISAAILNDWLDGLCQAVNWTAPVAFYVKLHLGDPGAAGTANPAANTTREAGVFGTGAAAGSIASTSDATWTNVPNAETYAYISFWDASTAGTFLGSAVLTTPRTVAIGDTFTVPATDLTLAVTPVAA